MEKWLVDFYFCQKDRDTKHNEEIEGEKSLNHDHLWDNFKISNRIQGKKNLTLWSACVVLPKKVLFERWIVIATMITITVLTNGHFKSYDCKHGHSPKKNNV